LNSALPIARAFAYQVLVGLLKCFELEENQSILIERDGDVSKLGTSVLRSEQLEVKHYADALTDNHENLWNTISNWLKDSFDHGSYESLILFTTQSFGAKSSLIDWNTMDKEERFLALKKIHENSLRSGSTSNVVKLQTSIFELDENDVKDVLSKVTLCTNSNNADEIYKEIYIKLRGIPEHNREECIRSLLGFIYLNSSETNWDISNEEFNTHYEGLTSKYSENPFRFPDYVSREATTQEQADHVSSPFVKKIHEIQYTQVIPEAIGNWVDLANNLNVLLGSYPEFKEESNKYQDQLIDQFKTFHRKASRKNSPDYIRIGQDLYDEIHGLAPLPTSVQYPPSITVKNGLIHDAMEKDEGLKWSIENE